MKAPFKKYFIFLGITYTLFILIASSVIFLVIGPQNKKLTEITRIAGEVKQQYEAANMSSVRQVQEQMLQRLEEKKQQLADMVIDSDKSASLTFDIGQIANQLEVQEFTSKRKDSQSQKILDGCDSLGETWIDISFEGSFLQFARFINSLERNTPVVFVEKFSIKRSLNDEDMPEIDLGVAFFVGQKELASAQ